MTKEENKALIERMLNTIVLISGGGILKVLIKFKIFSGNFANEDVRLSFGQYPQFYYNYYSEMQFKHINF